MNGLEFTSSLVETLVWPIVIVVGFLSFRDSLNGLFDRLGDVEGFGIKARLNREAYRVKEALEDKANEADKTRPPEEPDASPALLAWSESLERFQKTLARADGNADKGPNGSSLAVAMSWSALETLFDEAAQLLHIPETEKDLTLGQIAAKFNELGMVDSQYLDLLSRTEKLRNAFVHYVGNVSVGPDFVDIIRDAASVIERTVRATIAREST